MSDQPFNGGGQHFADVLSRRRLLQAAAGLPVASLLGCATSRPAAPGASAPATAQAPFGFTQVPISRADAVVVPEGYTWQVVNAWGDPIVRGGPEFARDASQPAADQARQAGMFHDGLAFFPLPPRPGGNPRGLVAINFEYTDDNLLHPGGMLEWTAEKVQKSKNAHGIGVLEVEFSGGAGAGSWKVVKDSPHGRRITADTPIELRGPAAGHPWLKTRADQAGKNVLGTWNNCAGGRTPWGTFLSCEENVTPYFVNDSGQISRLQGRYGVPTSKDSWGYRWQEFDERFDAARHPNEPNRHGWVVEIDPLDPNSRPVKRTALGRMAHEGATVTVAPDGRVVVYMGDDDFRSKFEHIYKFVSRRPWVKGGARDNDGILDEGTLYAARFDADGTGQWLPLVHGDDGLTADNGFASQAEVLIDTRTAADRVGATYMDRPEWAAVHPRTGEVYVTLSNNTSRGTGKPHGRNEPLGADAANPRAPNPMGHIIRWREQAGDPASTRFQWDIFLQAGDPSTCRPRSPGQRQDGRRLRPARRPGVRRPGGAVDPDRFVGPEHGHPGLGRHRQQPAAGRRSGHRRGPPFPHRAGGQRDRRARVQSGPANHVRQHPAPGRGAEGPPGPQRSGSAQGDQQLAGGRGRRPPAFGAHRGPTPRRRRDRDLITSPPHRQQQVQQQPDTRDGDGQGHRLLAPVDRGRGHRPLSEVILLQLLVQSGDGDAQRVGGLRLVAPGLDQRLLDRRPLDHCPAAARPAAAAPAPIPPGRVGRKRR